MNERRQSMDPNRDADQLCNWLVDQVPDVGLQFRHPKGLIGWAWLKSLQISQTLHCGGREGAGLQTWGGLVWQFS